MTHAMRYEIGSRVVFDYPFPETDDRFHEREAEGKIVRRGGPAVMIRAKEPLPTVNPMAPSVKTVIRHVDDIRPPYPTIRA